MGYRQCAPLRSHQRQLEITSVRSAVSSDGVQDGAKATSVKPSVASIKLRTLLICQLTSYIPGRNTAPLFQIHVLITW